MALSSRLNGSLSLLKLRNFNMILAVLDIYSQSNGKAESAVKTAKKLMKRAELSKSEIYLSFLDHRNTPNDSGYSPAQCLMNRRTKTLLPVTSNLIKPEISVNRHRSLCVSQRQKSYYDKHSKDLRSLEEGDVVRMKPFHSQQWKKATVCKRLADCSYRVETSDGILAIVFICVRPLNNRHLLLYPLTWINLLVLCLP